MFAEVAPARGKTGKWSKALAQIRENTGSAIV